MTLSPRDWDNRFRQQANWTRQIRQNILSRLNLEPASRVLEVGCGTGVITGSLGQDTPAAIFGLDLNLAFLRLARQNERAAKLTAGDALRLPFPDGIFDAVVCHFFLLWIPRPDLALSEIWRVTRKRGAVIAFAEPDYGGRIDYPDALAEIGRLQAAALKRQGADPNMGRKLSGLFHAAGLNDIETGLLGGQWRGQPSAVEAGSEWTVIEADLAGMLSPARINLLHELDEAAWKSGERTLFVPTFYSFGYKADG